MWMDSSSDVDGMLVTRNMMLPSCKEGMNSLPRKGISAKVASNKMTAPEMTFFLLSSAQSSNGKYNFFAHRTMKVSFSSLDLRISDDSTGTRVMVSSSEPTIAKVMVSAIGLNILPSRPVKENSGKNTTMMMRMANATGFITSRAASRMTWVLLTVLPA